MTSRELNKSENRVDYKHFSINFLSWNNVPLKGAVKYTRMHFHCKNRTYQLATLPAGGLINNSLSDADICNNDTAQCNAPTSHVMTNE